jgi:enterochelin esterase-like enzyme
MKKETLSNQVLTTQLLIFDPPEKKAVFKGPPPKREGLDAKNMGFSSLMPKMELADVEPAVKVLENGDVRFRFYAPEAKTVEVAGWGGGFSRDRNPMVKDEEGWWSTTVSGILPGFHYHDYFVDGNRMVNPDGLVGYGSFYGVNYFDLPTDEDEFWFLKDVPHGDVRMEYYKSSVNGRTKCAWVYTPPGYDAETDKYPVLYIQHGVGENEMGWVWQGKLNLIADNLIAQGRCKKLLIVMNTGYAFTEGEDPVFFPGDFDTELTKDCLPYIEGKYRALTDRHNRAVAGLSLGSIQALFIALKHRDLFANVGVFSGGFPIKRPEYDYTEYFNDAERVNSDFDLIFVSGGDNEGFLKGTLPMLEKLREKGIKITDYHRPGFHVWDVWRYSAYEMLQRLFM